jgi:hypothetical protein
MKLLILLDCNRCTGLVDKKVHIKNVLEFTNVNMFHLVVRKLFEVYVGKGPNTTDGEGVSYSDHKTRKKGPTCQQNKQT